ncbi:MAG TPA: NAD-dependent epimerase/dehydratase family protein, partial [Opitutaceae bacterium]|nr:NAD-dependent epimerase/dehydratase family protein [Opitutaceae bacterium]
VRVTALTRNAAKAAELRAAGCERVLEADLGTDAWHTAAEGPYDFVMNCVSAGGGGAAGYRHSYVDGMRSVSRWLAGQPRGGTIVYTSSTGVYPQGGGGRIDEEAPTEGAGENGRLLREAESELARGAGAADWRWFVLRLAGIYGPGRQGMLDEIRRGAATLRGEPTHRMNLVHRDDVCGAVWACFGAPAEVRDEVFNVSDNAPAPRAEVAGWLAQRLGVGCPQFGHEAGDGAPADANPFGRRRAPDRIIVAEKIRRVLGWAPRFPDYRAGYEEILAT